MDDIEDLSDFVNIEKYSGINHRTMLYECITVRNWVVSLSGDVGREYAEKSGSKNTEKCTLQLEYSPKYDALRVIPVSTHNPKYFSFSRDTNGRAYKNAALEAFKRMKVPHGRYTRHPKYPDIFVRMKK